MIDEFFSAAQQSCHPDAALARLSGKEICWDNAQQISPDVEMTGRMDCGTFTIILRAAVKLFADFHFAAQ
jgi:hypothetical protein